VPTCHSAAELFARYRSPPAATGITSAVTSTPPVYVIDRSVNLSSDVGYVKTLKIFAERLGILWGYWGIWNSNFTTNCSVEIVGVSKARRATGLAFNFQGWLYSWGAAILSVTGSWCRHFVGQVCSSTVVCRISPVEIHCVRIILAYDFLIYRYAFCLHYVA